MAVGFPEESIPDPVDAACPDGGAGLVPPAWGRMLRVALARAFWLTGRSLFEVRVRGLEHFTNQPATLLVANHTSDFDTILLLPTLYFAHGGRGPIGRCAFAAGEHLFAPEYLATYVLRRLGRLRGWLYGVSLARILWALRAYPIPRARRRKLAVHLRSVRELVGDARLADVLAVPVERLLPRVCPQARIGDVMRWRYQEALDAEHGFSIFKPALARLLRRRQLRFIDACLGRLSAVLEAGDCLFIAPEGELSPDGSLGEFRAGLCRILERVEREVVILPINITYDWMTDGRPAAFLSLGRQIHCPPHCQRHRLKAQLAAAVASLHTVTLGQLVCQALMGCADGWDLRGRNEVRLRKRVRAEAMELAQRGYQVDERLLTPGGFALRWERFLRYAQQRRWLGTPDQARDEPAIDPLPWRYAVNELHSALNWATVRSGRR
ncbi:MAG TPA: 1-acyl-sn-glycerol-3-phosphate acyltransferase [Phycisphaeraceae bacterium]